MPKITHARSMSYGWNIPLSRRSFLSLSLMTGASLVLGGCAAPESSPPAWAESFVRLPTNPIISPEILGKESTNINGPSLIRVPDWIIDPLGKYYLYFAHHHGKHIRLAYADDLEGPWQIYEPGTLQLVQTVCYDHIASPDVHVDDENQQIRLYFHGMIGTPAHHRQFSLIATSKDGIAFTASPKLLGDPYFRVFRWREWYYAIAYSGVFYRSEDGLSYFQEGPDLFSAEEGIRHTAVLVEGNILRVFHSNIGDAPEHIRLTSFRMRQDWEKWERLESLSILKPEFDFEGVDYPIEPSDVGTSPYMVHQLRDPAVFIEDGSIYLLYSIAGEQGIAIARADYAS